MFQLRALIIVLAIGTVTSALAAGPDQFDMQTVQGFKSACDSNDPAYLGFCAGYVTGISSMMLEGPAKKEMAMCLRGNVATVGARVQAFKNWAQKHPERWGEGAFWGVVAAMHETWPC